MATSARPGVIIDTDPGTDDAIALLMALGCPGWDVVGLTTVGGNVRLARAIRNTLAILEYVGRTDIPVFRGSARPLLGRFEYAYDFHGPGGLANTRLPAQTTPLASVGAVEYLARQMTQADHQPSFVALGPLTNLARLLGSYPQVGLVMRPLVVMGGAVGVPDSVLPRGSEFNFRGDPLAAQRVLSSGVPVTLVHLGACLQVGLQRSGLPRLVDCGRLGRLAARILANWFRLHPDRETYQLPDPLAVAVAIDPQVVRVEPTRLKVRIGGDGRRGETTVEAQGSEVALAVEVDQERYYRLLHWCLGEGRNP